MSDKLLHDTKEKLLMARWREPTLSLHGIEGAFYEPGAKTVIPRYRCSRCLCSAQKQKRHRCSAPPKKKGLWG